MHPAPPWRRRAGIRAWVCPAMRPTCPCPTALGCTSTCDESPSRDLHPRDVPVDQHPRQAGCAAGGILIATGNHAERRLDEVVVHVNPHRKICGSAGLRAVAALRWITPQAFSPAHHSNAYLLKAQRPG